MTCDVQAMVFRFPTPMPEADGTLDWDATTAVAVTITSGAHTGLGWTYGAGAISQVIDEHLSPVIRSLDLADIAACWSAMHRACRNIGTRGLVMQAISAVDIALWDLKGHVLDRPLSEVWGAARETVPVYGSGGFTTLSSAELGAQVRGWQAAGCTAMKIKIAEARGTKIDRDIERLEQLAHYAGSGVALMADANGGYSRGQAVRVGRVLDELGVVWFEEPVSSDDLEGLAGVAREVRCDVTAGEYASDVFDVARLCPVLDCLQLDVTRCGGYTGFLRCAAIAAAHNLEVSGHCAPALTVPVAACIPNLRHLEWFIDHARIEPLLAAGVPQARDGAMRPSDAAGHGMTLAEAG